MGFRDIEQLLDALNIDFPLNFDILTFFSALSTILGTKAPNFGEFSRKIWEEFGAESFFTMKVYVHILWENLIWNDLELWKYLKMKVAENVIMIYRYCVRTS